MWERDQSKSLRWKIITAIILIVIMVGFVVPLYQWTDESLLDCERVVLDEGWNITTNRTDGTTETFTDVDMSVQRVDILNKGDSITYSRFLTKEDEVKDAFLLVNSVHTTVQVYLDGEELYYYGKVLISPHHILGYGRSVVALPDEYAGKKLEVVMQVTEDDAFEGLGAMEIVEGTKAISYIMMTKRVGVTIAAFLIFFGILAMLLSILALFANPSMVDIFCIALFSLCIGCWTLCNDDIVTIVTPSLSVKSYIEYISLYAAPIPFTYYFHSRVMEEGCPKWLRIYYWILFGVEVAFFGLAILFQMTNLVHFPAVLIIDHIIIVFAIAFVVALAIVFARIRKKLKKSLVIGLGMSLVVIGYELVRYNLQKFVTGFADNTYAGTLSIAALIVVVALMADYVEQITSMVYKHAQQMVLEDMAYRDELTGLANRRKCDDLLVELKGSAKPYAVISMDMNLLKVTNDTYGHEKGDAALRAFARCLQEVFPEPYMTGRMGGDEFAVILPNAGEREVKDGLKALKALMKEEYIEGTDLHLSAACGYALSTECMDEDDAYEIYHKADERMYDDKRETKRRRATEQAAGPLANHDA